jgi:hypothetical protein
MNMTLQTLEYIELDAMDAPSDSNDAVRGIAIGLIIGVIALT